MRGRDTITEFLKAGRRLAGTDRPIVLMYRRVASLPVDPWRLAVSPEHSQSGCGFLTRERNPVPMHWLAKELREGRLPRRAAAVSFDDGYADVLQNALPIIRRFDCPACIFITTDAVENRSGFSWDVLSCVILETANLPEHLAIGSAGQSREWRFSNNPRQTSLSGAVDRETLHAILHDLLKPLGLEYRQSILEQLAAWAGTEAGLRPSDRAVTAKELRQLAASDGIVTESCHDCEAMIDRAVTGFAYPFGDHNDASVGLNYATSGRKIPLQTDPFRIPRILVADWDEAEFRREVLRHG